MSYKIKVDTLGGIEEFPDQDSTKRRGIWQPTRRFGNRPGSADGCRDLVGNLVVAVGKSTVMTEELISDLTPRREKTLVTFWDESGVIDDLRKAAIKFGLDPEERGTLAHVARCAMHHGLRAAAGMELLPRPRIGRGRNTEGGK